MEYIKTAKLVELENNPRTITKNDFKVLCKSLEDNPDYFEARPIIVSDRTGDLVVIAGNQRLKAAKKLRMNKVPVFVMKGLSEEREKEIVVRDNVSNGKWDMDLLSSHFETSDLLDWGVDIPKDWGTGFEEQPQANHEPPRVSLTIEFETLDVYQDVRQRISEVIEEYEGVSIKD